MNPVLPLPEGVRYLDSTQTRVLSNIRTKLQAEALLWGYREITVPAIEFGEDTPRRDPYPADRLYRFIDRKGQLLLLRPDFTQSVARMADRVKSERLPARFYYYGNVFRQQREGSGEPHELWQAGIELLGDPGATADAEVIAAGLAFLDVLGLADARVCVGYPSLARSIGGEAKDFPPMALSSAVDAFMQVVPEAGQRMWAYLEQLATALCMYGVASRAVFDLTLTRPMSYYSGPVFEFYSASGQGPLGGGGRYDGLVGLSSGPVATGLAIDVLRVAELMEQTRDHPTEEALGTLIGYAPSQLALAVSLARKLRASAEPAVITPNFVDREHLLALAREQRCRRVCWVSEGSLECADLPRAEMPAFRCDKC